jgi:tetratricopeptide (TPR) repeat protein
LIHPGLRRLTLLSVLALGGCTLLVKPVADVDIDALRQQHYYVDALEALEQQRANNPNYLTQRQQLLEEATLYQSQLLQSLRAAMDQQDYASAQKTLEQALQQLPANAELNAFNAEFDRARSRYVQDKLDDLYQLRGEHLLKEQPLYQSLQGFNGDYDLQIAVARYEADAEYFSRLLAAAGSQAMLREDYVAAQKYLTTANQLRPSHDLAAAIQGVQHANEARREREKQNRLNERDQRYRKLEAALQQSLDAQDFTQARTQLAALRDIGLRLGEVEQYRRRLDEAIGRYVAGQIDAGNKHYAEGHIEDALENWHAADALMPTPELKERIEKAEKFIQRYRDLQQEKRNGGK